MKNYRKNFVINCMLAYMLSACTSTVVKTNYSGNIIHGGKNNNLLYYYLPETILNITATLKIESCYLGDTLLGPTVLDRTYSVKPETIADTKKILILEYNKNNLFSDELSFAVNSKGLLTNSDIKADDKTASIIEDISKALVNKIEINATSDDILYEIKEYTRSFTVKASELNQNGKEINLKIIVLNTKNPNKKSEIVNDSYNISTPDENMIVYDLERLEADKNDNRLANGIFTRPIRNLNIMIKPNADKNAIFSNFVQISDPSKLLILPVNRTAFTNSSNNLKINDGIIIESKINRPSPVKGFVEIPINIAKAIVSIPAQLIQIKINSEGKSKDLLDAEKGRLTAEKERLEVEFKTKIELLKINARLDSLARKR